MILANEALALASLAVVAATFAGRGFVRYIKAGTEGLRVLVASCALSAFCWLIAIDEAYWGIARHLGMPDYLVYGGGPGALKFSSALLCSAVIWLYSLNYRVAKAIGVPLICYAVAMMARSLLG